MKASGLNGRRPSLYNRYKCNQPEKDYGEVHPRFDHQHYLSHPEQFLASQEDLEALSDFLWKRSSELETPMSINEHSFSIFGKEKLLKSVEKQFSTYFRLPMFSFEELNAYPTPEPFFEFISPDRERGAVLIIENKDTWYTLRKLMKEEHASTLFGISLKVFLYGEGKKITRQSGRLREYQVEGS